tara:strand:- start:184 stop:447 length:264 start_codon:yes stop_codon:yes gene_type:complete
MRVLLAALLIVILSATASLAKGPDQTKPDQTVPDQAKPDQTKPDQAKPDQTKPDQTKADEEKSASAARRDSSRTPIRTAARRVRRSR